jgi:hypothetical protein
MSLVNDALSIRQRSFQRSNTPKSDHQEDIQIKLKMKNESIQTLSDQVRYKL